MHRAPRGNDAETSPANKDKPACRLTRQSARRVHPHKKAVHPDNENDPTVCSVTSSFPNHRATPPSARIPLVPYAPPPERFASDSPSPVAGADVGVPIVRPSASSFWITASSPLRTICPLSTPP